MRQKNIRSLFEGNPHSPSLASIAEFLGRPPGALMDFCVPCNPYFPTEAVFEALVTRLRALTRYYPSDIEVIGKKLAAVLSLDPERLVVANGSDELIAWLDQLLAPNGVCTSIPTFNRWIERPRVLGRKVVRHELDPEDGFRFDPESFCKLAIDSGVSMAVVVNPNNPTGGYIEPDAIEYVIRTLSRLEAVIVDESFIDFASEDAIPSAAQFIDDYDHLVVLKSLGKNFGLHGLRLGYSLSSVERATWVRRSLPRWTVNALAEKLIEELAYAFDDYEAARKQVVRDRAGLEAMLGAVEGITVYPSFTNFVTFRLPEQVDGLDFRDRLLLDHLLFVRECGNKDGINSQFIRVASRRPEDNAILVGAIQEALDSEQGIVREAAPSPIAPRIPVNPAISETVPGLGEFELSLPVRPEWNSIDLLRRAIEETVRACTVVENAQSAVAMVVAELLEEAVQNVTPSGESKPEIQLLLRGSKGRAWVEVAAETKNTETVKRIEDAVDWINQQSRAQEAYGEALQRCLDAEPGPLKLRLVRVAFESGAAVSCDVAPEGLVRLRVELDSVYL